MAALYPGTSVSGYNSNPPPDDGTQVASNLITWGTDVKAKIGDPLNTFASNVDTNITGAFGKTLDGAAVLSTAISYSVLNADQGKLIIATAGGITITAPDPTVVTSPFMFAINNQSTGTITLNSAGVGPPNVDGVSSQTIQAGGGCIVKTDGAKWFTFGLQAAQVSTQGSQHGFTEPVNLSLTASVATNILTVAVKTKAGNDPSAGDPVLIPFRDTAGFGTGPIWLTITSALSINTNATGATLGTQSGNIPFRFWIACFNSAGSPVLALWHSGAGAATPFIKAPDETQLISTTPIGGSATSAGIWYTPNGTTLTNCAFRILGYLDYTTGLGTAGTYASTPTQIILSGPTTKKCGDPIQESLFTTTATSTTTSTSFADLTAAISTSFTPYHTTSLLKIVASGTGKNSAANDDFIQIARNTTLIGGICQATTGTNTIPMSIISYDVPATINAVTYHIFAKTSAGTMTFPANTGNAATIEIVEYMA